MKVQPPLKRCDISDKEFKGSYLWFDETGLVKVEVVDERPPPNFNLPFLFHMQTWKEPTNLFIDVWCRSFVALYPLASVAPSKDDPAIKTKHYACMLLLY
jgi:hypothetical protein